MAAAAASAGGWAEAKARGNRAYANGENAAAAAAYSEALRDESVPAAERATLLSNRAQVHLKAGAAALAVEDCTASLTHAPDNVKALYRRCVCAAEARLGARARAPPSASATAPARPRLLARAHALAHPPAARARTRRWAT